LIKERTIEMSLSDFYTCLKPNEIKQYIGTLEAYLKNPEPRLPCLITFVEGEVSSLEQERLDVLEDDITNSAIKWHPYRGRPSVETEIKENMTDPMLQRYNIGLAFVKDEDRGSMLERLSALLKSGFGLFDKVFVRHPSPYNETIYTPSRNKQDPDHGNSIRVEFRCTKRTNAQSLLEKAIHIFYDMKAREETLPSLNAISCAKNGKCPVFYSAGISFPFVIYRTSSSDVVPRSIKQTLMRAIMEGAQDGNVEELIHLMKVLQLIWDTKTNMALYVGQPKLVF
jgi:hypothetical protein